MFFFFFNDTATTEIYTLSLHDALPISTVRHAGVLPVTQPDSPDPEEADAHTDHESQDRKSTRLNSSHSQISYAVFCLKKKKRHNQASNLITHNRRQSHTLLNPMQRTVS